MAAEGGVHYQRPGWFTKHVFNPSDVDAIVSIDGHTGWLVDLRGRPLEPFDGSFALRPWGLATARLDG